MRVRFAAVILCLLPLSLLASNVQTAGKLFLLGAGARSDGLGGCGTLLGEATSGLFNPAAQTLTEDLSGTVFSNPRPYFWKGYDFLVLTAAARTEFGYIGASYLSRRGVDGSNYPPEEGSSLVLAGRPWRGLALGVALKILSTQKANFVPLNEIGAKTYKTAFDLGVLYAGLMPQVTLGKAPEDVPGLRAKYGRAFRRGLSIGMAFQNLGGRVEYDYAIDIEMLPQTFRADLLWAAYENDWCTVRVVGEAQKLLVERNDASGYENATNALFSAWGSSDREGGWTTRWGIEVSAFGLISGRIGWSADHGESRSFNHVGLGLGPEWLRANFAWVRKPGSDYSWNDGLRLDASANVSYEQVRGWMAIHD